MYRLRLLGGFALEVTEGNGAVRLPRRRPEALLALLALSGDLGCTRDRLIGLLWPDHDERHARHSLRDALHAVRKALGRDAVTSMGDILRLDPAHVWTDVHQFRDALTGGRLAEAVTAYRGPLLDGFHLTGAVEFARWLDEERSRLLHECLDAIRRLAEAAQEGGEWGEAAEWWGHSVALDPYNSRVVLRRVAALARAGDRANAVKEGEAHCGLLGSDLGMDPDPWFIGELERIRSGEVGPPRLSVPHGIPAGQEAGPPPGVVAPQAGPDSREAGITNASPRHADGFSLPETHAGNRGRSWRGARWALVGLALASLAAIALLRPGPSPEDDAPHVENSAKVTSSLGREEAPTWSPDGLALAFQSDHSGNWDIWVTQVGTGQATNRTEGAATAELAPTWSPDGQWIAFFSDREGGGYYVMPSVGGAARRIAPWALAQSYPTAAAWSPDATEVAYAVGQRGDLRIDIVSVATGVSRTLPLPVRPRNNVMLDLTWSPDGRAVAYRRAIAPAAATSELWLTDVSSGESVQVTDGSSWDASPTWSPDSRALYFVSNRNGTPDVWRFTVDAEGRPVGDPRQITSGMEISQVQLSVDGRRLAYTKSRTVRNVYRAPILDDRKATWDDVEQLTFDEADYESVDVSRDGRLVVSSDKAGDWDVYLMSAEGGKLHQFTTDSALDAGPRWNHDGSEVVFYSSRSGHREVWVKPASGGPAHQLSHHQGVLTYPTWSPTDLEIAAQMEQGIAVVDVATGKLRVLTGGAYAGKPDWSPDGEWIAYSANPNGRFAVWRVPVAGGEPERMTEDAGRPSSVPRWSLDGTRIYFLRGEEQGGDVWALSVQDREEWPITALRGRRGGLGRYTLATDGRFVYFTWEESRAEIWVANLVEPTGSAGGS